MGGKLGNPVDIGAAGQLGRASQVAAADAHALGLLPTLRAIRTGGAITLAAITGALNERNIPTPRGAGDPQARRLWIFLSACARLAWVRAIENRTGEAKRVLPKIAPWAFVLAVPDLDKSTGYFRDVLGFRVRWEDATEWRLVERDGVRIMLGHCPSDMRPPTWVPTIGSVIWKSMTSMPCMLR